MGFIIPDGLYMGVYDEMGGGNTIYRSIDGGNSWSLERAGSNFKSISFCNDTVGYCITYDGSIYKRGIIDGIKPISRNWEQEILIYPNPFASALNMEIPETTSESLLYTPFIAEIRAPDGKLIIEKYFWGRKFSINDLSDLSQGYYYLIIRNQSSLLTCRKFFKK